MAKQAVVPATPWVANGTSPYADQDNQDGNRDDGPPPAGLIHSDDFENFQENVWLSDGKFQWESGVYTYDLPDPLDAQNTALQFHYRGNVEDVNSEQRFALDALYQDLWIRYRIYVPNNYIHRDDAGSDNNKGWFQIWGDTPSSQDVQMRVEFERKNDNESRIVMYAKQNQSESSTQINGSVDSDGRLPTNMVCIGPSDLGKWVYITIHARVSDYLPATDGRCTIWKDDTLFCDYRDIDNSADLTDSSNAFNGGYLLGAANSGFAEDTDFYIDDFDIGDTAESIGFDTTVDPAYVG